MTAAEFTLNPALYGLPDHQQLKDLRIWSDHYHGLMGGVKQHEEMKFYIERMGIEKMIYLEFHDIDEKPFSDDEREVLEKEKDQLIGIVTIDPGFPEKSIDKIEKWVKNGPCIGIKFLVGKNGATCSDPRSDVLISLAAEMKSPIYIHTFLNAGGSPRTLYGKNRPGESTPFDVAALAKRFPNVPMICGHSGGDWELGARAIRPHENVLLEFAGSYPHSGSVEYAINFLGADRIVWGCHTPSRSYSTELSKVLDASISHKDRMKVLGENYRRTWAEILNKRGMLANGI